MLAQYYGPHINISATPLYIKSIKQCGHVFFFKHRYLGYQHDEHYCLLVARGKLLENDIHKKKDDYTCIIAKVWYYVCHVVMFCE